MHRAPLEAKAEQSVDGPLRWRCPVGECIEWNTVEVEYLETSCACASCFATVYVQAPDDPCPPHAWTSAGVTARECERCGEVEEFTPAGRRRVAQPLCDDEG